MHSVYSTLAKDWNVHMIQIEEKSWCAGTYYFEVLLLLIEWSLSQSE